MVTYRHTFSLVQLAGEHEILGIEVIDGPGEAGLQTVIG